MIELKNVIKYFQTKQGKNYILKNVSITIPDHKNIGILGRNGAGKSTLMRMLGQIEFPNSGKIFSSNTFSWPLGLSGGFVGNMTGRANIKFVCRLYGKNNKEIKEIITNIQEFSELGNYFDMPIKTYSSGMRSRLSFGLSLMFDFDYLLIDETLSVGDTRFKKKSKEALMKKIETCSVLLVSHDMETIKNICNAGIVVNHGQMYYFENVEDAILEYENINKKSG
jgi:capsular polysaccharide transport system ATP-binding protein